MTVKQLADQLNAMVELGQGNYDLFLLKNQQGESDLAVQGVIRGADGWIILGKPYRPHQVAG